MDHEWHKIDLKPYALPTAMCLRRDARLLTMDHKQFDLWNKDERLRARLHDMARGQGQQMESDRQSADKKAQEMLQNFVVNSKIDMSSRGGRPSHERCDGTDAPEAKNSAASIEKATTAKQSGHSRERGPLQAIGKDGSWDSKNVLPSRHNILPPCYCISCAKYFWDYFKEGFTELLDHNVAASRVRDWTDNIMAKSKSIMQALKQHEKALRRRWIKKNSYQRRKILEKACPSLMTFQGLASLLEERRPGQKGTKFAKPGRTSILISILILDELVANSDLLFEHLHDRTKHPSQHFFADFMRVESAALYKDFLAHPYIFGTFQITNDEDYGQWRTWEDGPVHRFEAVATPYSILVFESQSIMLDVLSKVLSELMVGLPASVDHGRNLVHNQSSAGYQPVTLPSLETCGSIHTTFPQITSCLKVAWNVTINQLEKVVDALSELKTNNSTFIERVRASQALRNATRAFTPGTSRKALAAVVVLAEPHDRVVTWLDVVRQFEVVAKTQDTTQNPTAEAHCQFMHEFKTLSAMLHHRFNQLLFTVGIICDDPISPDAIIPAGLLSEQWTIGGWLRSYFLSPPTQAIRIMALRHMEICCKQQGQDVRYINELVREWIDEVLVIRKVLEVLHAYRPTVHIHSLEPFNAPQTLWYNMCPSQNIRQYQHRMEQRGEELIGVLLPATEYTMPRGRRDAAWYTKQASARDVLRDTWTRYGEITLEYWKRKGFQPAWLDMISATLACAEPKDTDSASQPPHEASSPFKKQVISPPTTPTTPTLIPHQHGAEVLSERKLTKKKRDELNTPSEDGDEMPSLRKEAIVMVGPQVALTITKILVRETYLVVVESLFSNAQQQVTSIRWNTFLNFMRDAECHVKSSEGSRYTFTSRNVVTGDSARVVIHRPHPDATLRAVHLRNCRFSIVAAFGWRQEMFVTRR